MTTTAGTAQVTDGEFLLLTSVAELTGKPVRTLLRWCGWATAGKGPFAAVRVRRLGRPWGVHATDLAAFLASSTWPHPDDLAA